MALASPGVGNMVTINKELLTGTVPVNNVFLIFKHVEYLLFIPYSKIFNKGIIPQMLVCYMVWYIPFLPVLYFLCNYYEIVQYPDPGPCGETSGSQVKSCPNHQNSKITIMKSGSEEKREIGETSWG